MRRTDGPSESWAGPPLGTLAQPPLPRTDPNLRPKPKGTFGDTQKVPEFIVAAAAQPSPAIPPVDPASASPSVSPEMANPSAVSSPAAGDATGAQPIANAHPAPAVSVESARDGTSATGQLGAPIAEREPDSDDGASDWPVVPVSARTPSGIPTPATDIADAAENDDAPPRMAPNGDPTTTTALPRDAAPHDDAPQHDDAPHSAIPATEDEPATRRRPVTHPPQPGGYVRRSTDSPPKSMRPSSRHDGTAHDAPESLDADRARRALGRAEDRIRTLTKQLDTERAARDSAKSAQTDAERSQQQVQDAHSQLHRQHDSLRSLVAVRAERIRELEKLVERRDSELLEARRQRTEDASTHARELDELRLHMDEEKQRALDFLTASLAEKARLATPPSRDDLRQLKGVGPKFEKSLHAIGITRFAQIAAWTDEDVERFAAKLKTNAKRIRRDGWVERAIELAGDSGSSLDSIRPGDGEVEGSW